MKVRRVIRPRSVLFAASLSLTLILVCSCAGKRVIAYSYFDRKGVLCTFDGGWDLHRDKDGWHYTHPIVSQQEVDELHDLQRRYAAMQVKTFKTQSPVWTK